MTKDKLELRCTRLFIIENKVFGGGISADLFQVIFVCAIHTFSPFFLQGEGAILVRGKSHLYADVILDFRQIFDTEKKYWKGALFLL